MFQVARQYLAPCALSKGRTEDTDSIASQVQKYDRRCSNYLILRLRRSLVSAEIDGQWKLLADRQKEDALNVGLHQLRGRL